LDGRVFGLLSLSGLAMLGVLLQVGLHVQAGVETAYKGTNKEHGTQESVQHPETLVSGDARDEDEEVPILRLHWNHGCGIIGEPRGNDSEINEEN